ncbi:hypothetical protein ABZW49_37255 [Nonomuraea wenchangensis]
MACPSPYDSSAPLPETDDRPADALLIRPDAHVAWVAPVDEPAGAATSARREALSTWLGPA